MVEAVRRAGPLAAAVAVLALSLAGCQKAGTTAAGVAGASTAGPEAAAGAPLRKAGLWSLTRLRDGKPAEGLMGGATKLCVDAKSEGRLGALGSGMARELCPDQTMSRTPAGWSFASTCQLGPAGTVHTVGQASGDFGARYTVHSESDTTGSQFARLNGHHVTDLTATYEGPCPADMAPGDVLLPNGMKVNPQKMMAGGSHPPSPGAAN